MDQIVNVIIPLYNRSNHIKLLLENFDKIYQTGNSGNFVIHIADFKSTDINIKEHIKLYTFPVKVIEINHPFRLAYGLQTVANTIKNMNEILFFCDADAVFPLTMFQRIRESVVQNKHFYCPIVSYEKPDGSIWVSDRDHKGTGHIAVFNSDFVKSRGWSNSVHMKKTFWGGHDGYLFAALKHRLKPVRKIESDHYTRSHTRTANWYKTRVNRTGSKIVTNWEK
jgi:glycosyltransferase involved in cell wall biosynthesis